jgi:hypothetical protein
MRPCRSASYLTVLLVHSNSNRQAIKVLLPAGSMSTQLAHAPSLDLDPLNYKGHIWASLAVLDILGKDDI